MSVKKHIKEHKQIYITVAGSALGVVIGIGVGYCMFRKLNIEAQSTAQNIALLQWKPTAISKAVVVPQGHPGYVVQCVETGEIFMSQNQAAKSLGLDATNLSQHLNGKRSGVGGKTFTRLGVAQVE